MLPIDVLRRVTNWAGGEVATALFLVAMLAVAALNRRAAIRDLLSMRSR